MEIAEASTTSGQTAQADQQQPQETTTTTTPAADQTSTAGAENAEPAAPMSKNALKRLRRAQEWEDGREDRKRRRREKRVAGKARRREERAELLAQGADPAVLFAKRAPARLVPVSLILDCDFEAYMTDKERVSLSSQVTRCYSENRNFKYKAHLWISGWRGKLRERFETAMENQHAHWKGVSLEEGDFLAAAARAREGMRSAEGGEMADSLQRSADAAAANRWEKDEREPFPLPGPAPELDAEHADVVYLTSESPYTLERLEPNTSYVIGGLVDKNREKGLCYRRAVERGIRTARLPIGQYMKLRTRQILATNHVVEIMLRWLECEDWAEAFMRVIPKRKGFEMIADGDEDKTGNGGEDGDQGDQGEDGEENKEGGEKNGEEDKEDGKKSGEDKEKNGEDGKKNKEDRERNGEDEAKGSNSQDPK
ncbi:tRNA (guanine(9)-N1)-methyltransferase [Metarhizium anisopliae]|nr:tRNA (guanine(9)-N1)-methyltransferase [Metarhizium anisopliae]